VFYFNHILDDAIKHEDGAKFCVYVGTNTEALYVEICRCHIFVKYCTLSLSVNLCPAPLLTHFEPSCSNLLYHC
jgi:hypothetical protein